jgi:hypothetical protein
MKWTTILPTIWPMSYRKNSHSAHTQKRLPEVNQAVSPIRSGDMCSFEATIARSGHRDDHGDRGHGDHRKGAHHCRGCDDCAPNAVLHVFHADANRDGDDHVPH